MKIKNVIFHQIDKKATKLGLDKVTIDFAKDLLQPDDAVVQKFCDDILESYRQHNPIWGLINEKNDFHNKLESFYSPKPRDFIDFSKDICELIKNELAKCILGTGGFVLILNYTYSEKEWLLIAMLKNDEGYGLTEALALEKRKYLNIKKLHESARINIEQWRNNISLKDDEKVNCLSFMKGARQKDSEVTEYFRDALGCIGYHSSNRNTKEVINAITDYMESKSYDSNKKDLVRDTLYNYFSTQYQLDLEIDLETISRKVNAEEPEDFTNYLKENNLNIDSSFKPSEKSFIQLRKLSFTVGDVKVSFSYDDINDKVILSDEGLLIKPVPKHIVKEIDEYKPRITQITLKDNNGN
nr:nucleoid-associated protein [Acinetobacter oleivorans]